MPYELIPFLLPRGIASYLWEMWSLYNTCGYNTNLESKLKKIYTFLKLYEFTDFCLYFKQTFYILLRTTLRAKRYSWKLVMSVFAGSTPLYPHPAASPPPIESLCSIILQCSSNFAFFCLTYCFYLTYESVIRRCLKYTMWNEIY